MRKLSVILLMTYYGIGTIILPMGDFSNAKYFAKVYDQCSKEDPDMDALDFVFEHLMNLEIVCQHFETPGNEENEKPHQPLQQLQSLSQTLVVLNNPMQFEAVQDALFPVKINTYLLSPDNFISSPFLTEVFHPPLFI